jgi:hypothetical protein
MRRATTRGPKLQTGLASALITLAIFLTLAAPRTAFALHRVTPHRHRILHAFHFRGLRGMLWNPLFRPSHDSLLRQNEEIDRLDLPRIQDDEELEALKASGELVPIKETESLKIERSLDPSRRYCRPWTRDFVARPFRGLLRSVPRTNPTEFRCPHCSGAEKAPPSQSQCRSRRWRHRLFSSRRNHRRPSAPWHDERPVALRRTLFVLSERHRVSRARGRTPSLVLPHHGFRPLQSVASDPNNFLPSPNRRTRHPTPHCSSSHRRLQLVDHRSSPAVTLQPVNSQFHVPQRK